MEQLIGVDEGEVTDEDDVPLWRAALEGKPGSEVKVYPALNHGLFAGEGVLSPAVIEGTIALGRATGLQVIASGGVSTVEEIRTLAKSGAVAGAVIGMALYERKLSLRDALEAAKG